MDSILLIIWRLFMTAMNLNRPKAAPKAKSSMPMDKKMGMKVKSSPSVKTKMDSKVKGKKKGKC